MFKGVSSDIKLLLASVTITAIGILLPWFESMRGFHLNYGMKLEFLLIIGLMVAHISRKMLASILIVIIGTLSFFVVLQYYFNVELFGSGISNIAIGAYITGLGTIGIVFAGISGIINHRDNRS